VNGGEDALLALYNAAAEDAFARISRRARQDHDAEVGAAAPDNLWQWRNCDQLRLANWA